MTMDITTRLQRAESGMISDAMVRLGLSGWMDEVKALSSPQPLVVGRARPFLLAPRRGEGAWPHSMYATIDMLDPGDILVIATGGVLQNVMGDNMVNFAAARGLAAMVTDAPVRDVAAIRAIGMPVYARSPATRIPLQLEPVALDVPVVCGGAQVRPGDYLVADEDGVVVVPQSKAEAVAHQVEEIIELEAELAKLVQTKGAEVAAVEALIKRKKAVRAA